MKKEVSKAAKTSAGFKLSRSAFEKISAVEGIRYSGALKSELADYDRRGLTSAQRAGAIREKYGKNAD
jgi:hypothetical protein